MADYSWTADGSGGYRVAALRKYHLLIIQCNLNREFLKAYATNWG